MRINELMQAIRGEDPMTDGLTTLSRYFKPGQDQSDPAVKYLTVDLAYDLRKHGVESPKDMGQAYDLTTLIVGMGLQIMCQTITAPIRGADNGPLMEVARSIDDAGKPEYSAIKADSMKGQRGHRDIAEAIRHKKQGRTKSKYLRHPRAEKFILDSLDHLKTAGLRESESRGMLYKILYRIGFTTVYRDSFDRAIRNWTGKPGS